MSPLRLFKRCLGFASEQEQPGVIKHVARVSRDSDSTSTSDRGSLQRPELHIQPLDDYASFAYKAHAGLSYLYLFDAEGRELIWNSDAGGHGGATTCVWTLDDLLAGSHNAHEVLAVAHTCGEWRGRVKWNVSSQTPQQQDATAGNAPALPNDASTTPTSSAFCQGTDQLQSTTGHSFKRPCDGLDAGSDARTDAPGTPTLSTACNTGGIILQQLSPSNLTSTHALLSSRGSTGLMPHSQISSQSNTTGVAAWVPASSGGTASPGIGGQATPAAGNTAPLTAAPYMPYAAARSDDEPAHPLTASLLRSRSRQLPGWQQGLAGDLRNASLAQIPSGLTSFSQLSGSCMGLPSNSTNTIQRSGWGPATLGLGSPGRMVGSFTAGSAMTRRSGRGRSLDMPSGCMYASPDAQSVEEAEGQSLPPGMPVMAQQTTGPGSRGRLRRSRSICDMQELVAPTRQRSALVQASGDMSSSAPPRRGQPLPAAPVAAPATIGVRGQAHGSTAPAGDLVDRGVTNGANALLASITATAATTTQIHLGTMLSAGPAAAIGAEHFMTPANGNWDKHTLPVAGMVTGNKLHAGSQGLTGADLAAVYSSRHSIDSADLAPSGLLEDPAEAANAALENAATGTAGLKYMYFQTTSISGPEPAVKLSPQQSQPWTGQSAAAATGTNGSGNSGMRTPPATPNITNRAASLRGPHASHLATYNSNSTMLSSAMILTGASTLLGSASSAAPSRTASAALGNASAPTQARAHAPAGMVRGPSAAPAGAHHNNWAGGMHPPHTSSRPHRHHSVEGVCDLFGTSMELEEALSRQNTMEEGAQGSGAGRPAPRVPSANPSAAQLDTFASIVSGKMAGTGTEAGTREVVPVLQFGSPLVPHAQQPQQPHQPSTLHVFVPVSPLACDTDPDMQADQAGEGCNSQSHSNGNVHASALTFAPRASVALGCIEESDSSSHKDSCRGSQVQLYDGLSGVGGQQPTAAGPSFGPGLVSAVLDLEIQALEHPAHGRVLLVSARDVSARAALEDVLTDLTESQVAMVAQMFPRHVIEALSGLGAKAAAAATTAAIAATAPATTKKHDLQAADKQADEDVETGNGQQEAGAAAGDGGAAVGGTGTGTMLGALGGAAVDLGALARSHTDVTLLFMDICGFTSMSKSVPPSRVMCFLNELFSHFDALLDVHGVHKVETAGDCYIVSGGVLGPDAEGFQQVLDTHDPADSAARVMAFAKDMLATARIVSMPDTGLPVSVRVGLHTGPCTSGLIGSRLPKFSLFGDSMNTASRMESTCPVGRIQVSESTHKLLQHESWEATGGVEVKGKGTMLTYLWVESQDASGSHLHSGTVTTKAGSNSQCLPSNSLNIVPGLAALASTAALLKNTHFTGLGCSTPQLSVSDALAKLVAAHHQSPSNSGATSAATSGRSTAVRSGALAAAAATAASVAAGQHAAAATWLLARRSGSPTPFMRAAAHERAVLPRTGTFPATLHLLQASRLSHASHRSVSSNVSPQPSASCNVSASQLDAPEPTSNGSVQDLHSTQPPLQPHNSHPQLAATNMHTATWDGGKELLQGLSRSSSLPPVSTPSDAAQPSRDGPQVHRLAQRASHVGPSAPDVPAAPRKPGMAEECGPVGVSLHQSLPPGTPGARLQAAAMPHRLSMGQAPDIALCSSNTRLKLLLKSFDNNLRRSRSGQQIPSAPASAAACNTSAASAQPAGPGAANGNLAGEVGEDGCDAEDQPSVAASQATASGPTKTATQAAEEGAAAAAAVTPRVMHPSTQNSGGGVRVSDTGACAGSRRRPTTTPPAPHLQQPGLVSVMSNLSRLLQVTASNGGRRPTGTEALHTGTASVLKATLQQGLVSQGSGRQSHNGAGVGPGSWTGLLAQAHAQSKP